MVKDSSVRSYHAAYWKLVNKFGRDGVHFLERWAQTNPIRGANIQAAESVVREWRDIKDTARSSKSERRANLSLWIAGSALLMSGLTLFIK